MRQLTTDNNVFVSFDPFGFSIFEFHIRISLMRYNSLGDLYLITSPSYFASLASSLWHNCLGHPRPSILQSLHKNKFIISEHLNTKTIYNSFVFGNHVKLSCNSSKNVTLMPFDILHVDLWTSPILSSSGHQFYILFLDEYSDFLWIFPLSNKSQVFEKFTLLSSQILTQFSQTIKCFQCDNGCEYNNSLFH